REAGGNPYLLRELAQNPVTEPIEKEESGRRASLDRVLRARIEQLPAPAQALLEIVAVAGQPLDQQAAVDAAQVAGQDRSAVALLRASRLLTVRTMPGGAFVDTYHDRIRQAVGHGLLPERRRQHHMSLAVVLEHRPGTDPETLAEHLLAADA